MIIINTICIIYILFSIRHGVASFNYWKHENDIVCEVEWNDEVYSAPYYILRATMDIIVFSPIILLSIYGSHLGYVGFSQIMFVVSSLFIYNGVIMSIIYKGKE